MFDQNHQPALRRMIVGGVLLIIGLSATFIVWGNTLQSPQTLKWSRWAYSEWLISYANGFVRRGAIGELLLLYFSNSLVSTVNHIVFILYVTLIAAFCFLILLRGEDNIARAAVAILIPCGIAHMALTNEFYYRKEIIFYIYLAIIGIVAVIQEGKSQKVRLITSYLFALLSLLMLLIHESFIFITLPATLMIMNKWLANIRTKTFLIGLIALQAIVFAILTFFKGSVETAQAIWDRVPVTDRLIIAPDAPDYIISPAAPDFVTGGIGAIGWTLAQAINLPIAEMLSGFVWLWVLAAAGLVFILWLFFGQSNVSERTSFFDFVDRKFVFSVVGIFGPSLPLYLLGSDWGRWLSASVISTIIVYYACLHPDLRQYSSGLKLVRIQHSLSGTLLLLCLIIAFSLVVRVPECCIAWGERSLTP